MHNLTQVLLRNSNLLSANFPLLVNLPADDFMLEYLALFPSAKPSYFTTNFEQYQAVNNAKPAAAQCYFSAQYQSQQKHDLVILAFPKSKAELAFTLAMLASSISDNATVLIVGENKSGIKSVPKLTTNTLNYCKKVDSARHCSLFCGQFINQNKTFNIDDWFKYYSLNIDGVSLEIASLPGVFSQHELDVGTQLLLENLPKGLTGSVLDFGCGAGVIASFVHKKNPTTAVTLVDVSALALCSAEKTLALNNITGAKYLPSNSLSQVTGKFNHVISNPPFHQGINTNYQATETFLEKIKQHMQARASITVVANSFLRYQPIMEKAIAATKILTINKGFTVYHSVVK